MYIILNFPYTGINAKRVGILKKTYLSLPYIFIHTQSYNYYIQLHQIHKASQVEGKRVEKIHL